VFALLRRWAAGMPPHLAPIESVDVDIDCLFVGLFWFAIRCCHCSNATMLVSTRTRTKTNKTMTVLVRHSLSFRIAISTHSNFDSQKMLATQADCCDVIVPAVSVVFFRNCDDNDEI
jgi:hypothetical protein